MREDRFIKAAEGDADKARELRSEFFKIVSAGRADHRACDHPSTRNARQACLRARRKAEAS